MTIAPIFHPTAKRASAYYSPGLLAGDYFFVSGQLGIDPSTESVPDDVAGQTKQALENLSRLLEQAGLSMASVVKTTVFLTDMKSFDVMNSVYVSSFSQPLPARSTIEVSALSQPRYKVEIEAIALARQ